MAGVSLPIAIDLHSSLQTEVRLHPYMWLRWTTKLCTSFAPPGLPTLANLLDKIWVGIVNSSSQISFYSAHNFFYTAAAKEAIKGVRLVIWLQKATKDDLGTRLVP